MQRSEVIEKMTIQTNPVLQEICPLFGRSRYECGKEFSEEQLFEKCQHEIETRTKLRLTVLNRSPSLTLCSRCH